VIHALALLHRLELLKATTRNERMDVLKVRSQETPLQRVLTLCGTGDSYSHATTISMLPDLALLEIFDFYQINHNSSRIQWWSLLVHVCRRWRQIIFESPIRLNLQIRCTRGTPVKKHLRIWPAFPIVIDYYRTLPLARASYGYDIIAALKHPGRVSFFKLQAMDICDRQAECILSALQKPFPLLTHFDIELDDNLSVLPADFLGGSAPRLQEFALSGMPYPSLPMLLLTTTDLVKLDVFDIPPTGYISPEAMVASLAGLPKLEVLAIGFLVASSRPAKLHRPPLTRTVLPAITSFRFRGFGEYLEDLVARIDCPQLNQTAITYLNQVVDFQVVQFSNFIDRTVGPEVTLFKHARFTFSYRTVAFTTYPHANHSPWDRRPATNIISCQGIDCQVSHIAQVLSHMSAKLSNVVHLKLKVDPEGLQLERTDDVEWTNLLRQFSTLQTLHVSRGLAGLVALALEGIATEMVGEVLPSLDLICVVGQPASSIENFIAARKLSGRPVTVIETETEFGERLESYVSE
jgi:hypothetical protein